MGAAGRLLALVSRMTSHAVARSRKLLELFIAACFACEDVVGGIDKGLGLIIPARLLTLRRLVFVQSGEEAGELLLFLLGGLATGYLLCQAALHGDLHDFFDRHLFVILRPARHGYDGPTTD